MQELAIRHLDFSTPYWNQSENSLDFFKREVSGQILFFFAEGGMFHIHVIGSTPPRFETPGALRGGMGR